MAILPVDNTGRYARQAGGQMARRLRSKQNMPPRDTRIRLCGSIFRLDGREVFYKRYNFGAKGQHSRSSECARKIYRICIRRGSLKTSMFTDRLQGRASSRT
jgi:hypothetical protein